MEEGSRDDEVADMSVDSDGMVWPPTPLMRFFVSEARGKPSDLGNDSPGWTAYKDYLRGIGKEKE